MFGRIFGRGKDETDPAVCAQCGRTLLVGEWTQNVVGADGQEYLICSLCGQSASVADVEPVATGTTPANNGRVRESRTELSQAPEYEGAPAPDDVPVAAAAGFAAAAEVDQSEERHDARGESDAFWRALKEKDAEIERLQAELARADAEKQELAGQLAAARAQVGAQAEAGVPQAPLVPAAAALAVGAWADAAPEPGEQPSADAVAGPSRIDASEPGERTWGETPAEFASELAALRDEEAALQAETPAGDAGPQATPFDEAPAAAAASPIVFETTQPIPALTDEMIAADAGTPAASHAEEAETTLTPDTGVPVVEATVAVPPEPTAAELEAEAASLTLLQRGVDLLNVSPVPHKIADTSGQLGLPMVNVGFDGQTTVVTFMWSMGWYRYEVDSENGAVRMADRGYEERTDLPPNASVRADGTVQLAPAQISRAAKAPAGNELEPAGPAAPGPAAPPAEPEPPSVAAQKAPEILSKSLLGQRSDDDVASWEQTQARDFDWNR